MSHDRYTESIFYGIRFDVQANTLLHRWRQTEPVELHFPKILGSNFGVENKRKLKTYVGHLPQYLCFDIVDSIYDGWWPP